LNLRTLDMFLNLIQSLIVSHSKISKNILPVMASTA
jgi:hypothetical protein